MLTATLIFIPNFILLLFFEINRFGTKVLLRRDKDRGFGERRF
jgi:hypothetical protein